MKVIHCNIWGDIELSDLAIKIIDTQEFQRLHHIKQTSCAYKVFPTAKTSRFEHSIGVYYLTGALLENLLSKQPFIIEKKDLNSLNLVVYAMILVTVHTLILLIMFYYLTVKRIGVTTKKGHKTYLDIYV